MKIQEVIDKLNEHQLNGNKLQSVKLINEIRGGGLLVSKEIADNYFNYNKTKEENNYGKKVIDHLKENQDWETIKKIIRKYKI